MVGGGHSVLELRDIGHVHFVDDPPASGRVLPFEDVARTVVPAPVRPEFLPRAVDQVDAIDRQCPSPLVTHPLSPAQTEASNQANTEGHFIST